MARLKDINWGTPIKAVPVIGDHFDEMYGAEVLERSNEMRVKKVTAKQAEKIMNRLGLDYGNDGRTYYLAKEDETAIWEFDTLAERNEAYEAEMKLKFVEVTGGYNHGHDY